MSFGLAITTVEGYSITPSSWAVSLVDLPELKIMLPAGATGRSEIVVTLVSIDGSVLAETKSMLAISLADQRSVATRDAGPPVAPSILRVGGGDETERSGQPPQSVTQPTTPQERCASSRRATNGWPRAISPRPACSTSAPPTPGWPRRHGAGGHVRRPGACATGRARRPARPQAGAALVRARPAARRSDAEERLRRIGTPTN